MHFEGGTSVRQSKSRFIANGAEGRNLVLYLILIIFVSYPSRTMAQQSASNGPSLVSQVGGYLTSRADPRAAGTSAALSCEVHPSFLTRMGVAPGDHMEAVIQDDGNFVVNFVEGHIFSSDDRFQKWQTDSHGPKSDGPYKLARARDCALAVTNRAGTELWSYTPAAKYQQAPCDLAIQPDGNLVLYNAHLLPIWTSRTAGQNHGGPSLISQLVENHPRLQRYLGIKPPDEPAYKAVAP
jgi:hypothetical protein